MKKLVRDKMGLILNPDELSHCDDKEELMNLYSLKLKEEIEEIKDSDYKDIMEYADLIQVTLGLASLNGYSFDDIIKAMNDKYELKGGFSNLVLTNLNPNNPSNKIYFNESEIEYSYWEVQFINCESDKRWVIVRTPINWDEYDVRERIPMGGSGDDVAEITDIFKTSDNYYGWDFCD